MLINDQRFITLIYSILLSSIVLLLLHIQLRYAIAYQRNYQQQLSPSGEEKFIQLQQQAAKWREQYEQRVIQVRQRQHNQQCNIISLQGLSQVVASKPPSILLTAVHYSANQLQIDGLSSSQRAVYDWLSELLKKLPGQQLNEPQVRWPVSEKTAKLFQIDIVWNQHV